MPPNTDPMQTKFQVTFDWKDGKTMIDGLTINDNGKTVHYTRQQLGGLSNNNPGLYAEFLKQMQTGGTNISYSGEDGNWTGRDWIAYAPKNARNLTADVTALGFDGNADGNTSFDEMVTAGKQLKHDKLDPKLKGYDTNKDGNVSMDEIAAAAKLVKHDKLDPKLKGYDTNKDGNVSMDEIAAAAKLVKHDKLDPKLKGYDTNKDGNVSMDEIAAAAKLVKHDKLDPKLKALDTNKDGSINFDEIGGGGGVRGSISPNTLNNNRLEDDKAKSAAQVKYYDEMNMRDVAAKAERILSDKTAAKARLDGDGSINGIYDGKVTRAEALAKHDKNKDGHITSTELGGLNNLAGDKSLDHDYTVGGVTVENTAAHDLTRLTNDIKKLEASDNPVDKQKLKDLENLFSSSPEELKHFDETVRIAQALKLKAGKPIVSDIDGRNDPEWQKAMSLTGQARADAVKEAKGITSLITQPEFNGIKTEAEKFASPHGGRTGGGASSSADGQSFRDPILQNMDTDKNGRISVAELKAAQAAKTGSSPRSPGFPNTDPGVVRAVDGTSTPTRTVTRTDGSGPRTVSPGAGNGRGSTSAPGSSPQSPGFPNGDPGVVDAIDRIGGRGNRTPGNTTKTVSPGAGNGRGNTPSSAMPTQVYDNSGSTRGRNPTKTVSPGAGNGRGNTPSTPLQVYDNSGSTRGMPTPSGNGASKPQTVVRASGNGASYPQPLTSGGVKNADVDLGPSRVPTPSGNGASKPQTVVRASGNGASYPQPLTSGGVKNADVDLGPSRVPTPSGNGAGKPQTVVRASGNGASYPQPLTSGGMKDADVNLGPSRVPTPSGNGAGKPQTVVPSAKDSGIAGAPGTNGAGNSSADMGMGGQRYNIPKVVGTPTPTQAQKDAATKAAAYSTSMKIQNDALIAAQDKVVKDAAFAKAMDSAPKKPASSPGGAYGSGAPGSTTNPSLIPAVPKVNPVKPPAKMNIKYM